MRKNRLQELGISKDEKKQASRRIARIMHVWASGTEETKSAASDVVFRATTAHILKPQKTTMDPTKIC